MNHIKDVFESSDECASVQADMNEPLGGIPLPPSTIGKAQSSPLGKQPQQKPEKYRRDSTHLPQPVAASLKQHQKGCRLFYFDRDVLHNLQFILRQKHCPDKSLTEQQIEQLLERLIQGIYQLELANRRTVQQNVQVVLKLRQCQSQLERKEHSFVQLNCKLTHVIEQLDQHQREETSQAASMLVMELSQLINEGKLLDAAGVTNKVRHLLKDLQQQREKADYLEELLVKKQHHDDQYLCKVLEKSTKLAFEKNQMELRMHQLEKELQRNLQAMKNRPAMQFVDEPDEQSSIALQIKKMPSNETMASSRKSIEEKAQEEWVQEILKQLQSRNKEVEDYSIKEKQMMAEALRTSDTVKKALRMTESLEAELRGKDQQISCLMKKMGILEKEKEAILARLSRSESQLKQLQSLKMDSKTSAKSTNTELLDFDSAEQLQDMRAIILQLEEQNTSYQQRVENLQLEVRQLKGRASSAKAPSVSASSDQDSPHSARISSVNPESVPYPRTASEFNKMVAYMLLQNRLPSREQA